jgi:PIN like domain
MGADEPARFFVDENDLALGRSLALARRDVVHPSHPRLPQVPLGLKDSEWLRIVGSLGLVVITRDKKIRSRPVEAA